MYQRQIRRKSKLQNAVQEMTLIANDSYTVPVLEPAVSQRGNVVSTEPEYDVVGSPRADAHGPIANRDVPATTGAEGSPDDANAQSGDAHGSNDDLKSARVNACRSIP